MARVVLLSVERIALRQLGQGAPPGSVMAWAYAGAAAVLWIGAVFAGRGAWNGSAWLAAAIYGGAFAAYAWALQKGPVSVVSPWANATAVLLFLVHPIGGVLAWAGVAAFLGGIVLLGGANLTPGVAAMMVSDGLLAWGRLTDAHLAGDPWSYGATLYTLVAAGMTLGARLAGPVLPEWARLWRRRPGWVLVAPAVNGASYLTLLVLMARLGPAPAEAASGLAGLGGALLGRIWLKEAGTRPGWVGVGLMTAGAIAVLYDHGLGFRVK